MASLAGSLTSGALQGRSSYVLLSTPPPLQGLDGEATEDVIRELQEPQAEVQDPEVQFAAAAALYAPFVSAAAEIPDKRSDDNGVQGSGVAAEAPFGNAGCAKDGETDSGLAVLVRVLSSPRATANPTHVYMLLRILDAASKLKVCAWRSIALSDRLLIPSFAGTSGAEMEPWHDCLLHVHVAHGWATVGAGWHHWQVAHV